MNRYSYLYSKVWYLPIFVIYLNSNTSIMFIKYIYIYKITSSKKNLLPHVKTTLFYFVFKCLISICICYLFEFKHFNYVLGFFPLSFPFRLKLRTLSLSHFLTLFYVTLPFKKKKYNISLLNIIILNQKNKLIKKKSIITRTKHV